MLLDGGYWIQRGEEVMENHKYTAVYILDEDAELT